MTRNGYPYEGAAAHYLIVARRHVASFDELPDEAGAELWRIRRGLKGELAPLAMATVERSGDMRFNGGSVAHLHVHLVALDEAAGPQEPVPLGAPTSLLALAATGRCWSPRSRRQGRWAVAIVFGLLVRVPRARGSGGS